VLPAASTRRTPRAVRRRLLSQLRYAFQTPVRVRPCCCCRPETKAETKPKPARKPMWLGLLSRAGESTDTTNGRFHERMDRTSERTNRGPLEHRCGQGRSADLRRARY